jgi:N-acetylmuramoyl-L-alanine amidase
MRLTSYLPFIALALLVVGCNPTYRTTTRELGIPKAERIVEQGKVTLIAPGKSKPHEFNFTIGQRAAMIDGVSYFLNKPAGTQDLHRVDIDLLRTALVKPPAPRKVLNILLDPGHGGTDSGCRKDDVHEQKITLAIAREVQAILKARGHTVSMTRTDEKTTRSLAERAQQGATLKVDAFVSIHVNASGNVAAKGVETYTLPAVGCEGSHSNSPARGPLAGHAHLASSTRLAYYVHQSLLSADGVTSKIAPADRGVRHAHFKVLRDTPAPSILIETGFITNAEDYARITNPQAQKVIARQIADGITKAFCTTK